MLIYDHLKFGSLYNIILSIIIAEIFNKYCFSKLIYEININNIIYQQGIGITSSLRTHKCS